MRMICCGVSYDTNSPDTYWCISKYKTKELLKRFVGRDKVTKEEIYVLLCKKNGCSKVEIHRYGKPRLIKTKSGKEKLSKNLLERTYINSSKGAVSFISQFQNNFIQILIPEPIKNVNSSKTIPFVYGKVEDGTTQSERYINETGYRNKNSIHSEVKTYKQNT